MPPSISTPRLSFFLLASVASLAPALAVACGGSPFDIVPSGAGGDAGSDDGGPLTVITVGPPDGSLLSKDGASPSPFHDASTDATLGDDASTPDDDAEPPHDATLPSDDAGQPVDAGTPDTSPACTGTQKLCGSGCVDVTDPGYGCAAASCAACDLPNATNVCSPAGACAVGTCTAGFADCTASPGCETNITTAAACGSCSTACQPSAPYCLKGTGGTYACSDDCPDASPTLCGTTCVDETTDPNHCGGCSNACTDAGANATNQCVSSKCEVACNSGYDPCKGGCVDYANDNSNCGSCGHACPTVASGSDTCAASTCTVTCNPNYSLCTNTGTDTCENLSNDPDNCGTCGHTCPTIANGSDACDSKVCTPACNNGYQLCTVSGVTTCVAPDQTTGVFVSTSSSATSGCGAITAPCGTIAAGIAAAQSLGKTTVYIDKGTYAAPVTLATGITLQGGWIYEGAGTWSLATCTGVTDPSTLAVIQPTSGSIAVTANGVTATLDTLTVKNASTASAGESLYGIFATGTTTKLTLDAVEISVGTGGAGTGATGTGSAPTGPTSPCAASDGGVGAAVANGITPDGGTYSIAGFAPASGTNGAPGSSGNDGTAGGPANQETTTPMTCEQPNCVAGTSQTYVTGAGTNGCGGPGGAAGLAGSGGGASIGLFVWEASVSVAGGKIASGNGGGGGQGSAGSAAPTSWSGMAGAVGSGAGIPTCHSVIIKGGAGCAGGDFELAGGDAGGAGGAGSSGGKGGTGAGGDSYSYYVGGGGSVTPSGSPTLTFGTVGGGGHAAEHN